jgi:hypothetical protein
MATRINTENRNIIKDDIVSLREVRKSVTLFDEELDLFRIGVELNLIGVTVITIKKIINTSVKAINCDL